jgi:hypothetical protein
MQAPEILKFAIKIIFGLYKVILFYWSRIILKEFVVSEVNSLGHKNCGGMSRLGRYVDQLPFAEIAGTQK